MTDDAPVKLFWLKAKVRCRLSTSADSIAEPIRSLAILKGVRMSRLFIPIIAVALLTGTYSKVHAQRVPSYQRTPTISPYTNLFRGDAGGLNNYFTLVRPQQRQIMFNQNQMAQNRLLERQVMYNNQQLMMGPTVVGQQFDASAGGLSLRPGTQTMQAPMPAASYFNYSHFYGVPVTGAASGVRPTGRTAQIGGATGFASPVRSAVNAARPFR